MQADCKSVREKRPNTAFSLIELMVVIAIIVLLAGMLVPSVGVVREKGKETTCANNIRQWAQAMSMYLDEHRGVFPTDGKGDAGDAKAAWYNVLPPYIGVDTFDTLKELGKAPCPGIGRSIYICPSAPIDTQKAANYADGSQVSYHLSYALNYWINPSKSDGNTSSRMRLSQVRYSDAFVVFSEPEDAEKKSVVANLANSPGSSVPGFWHRKRVNVAFADGHVAPVRQQNIGSLQWNPKYKPGEEPGVATSGD